MLQVEYVPITSIKPYKKNAKQHPRDQVERIKKSIQEFGFNDPIGVWHDEIVEGHGRYMAAQALGMDTVPVIRLDGLTDEQRRAYVLVHNKLTMDTGFDLGFLDQELKSILDINMSDYGFLDEEEREDIHQDYKDNTEFARSNILNLEKGQYPGAGPYDIPILQPVYELPEIKEWIGFNYVLSDKNPEGKAVHFFVDDYQFERVWNNPDAYIEKLSQYVCVASPDFSPYGDMPQAAQIWNHYRKHWVGAYFQECGLTVIPTIRSSSDPRSFEWYLDGEPEGGIVLVSSMWKDKTEEEVAYSQKFWEKMNERQKTKKVIVYGTPVEWWNGPKIEQIPSFSHKRWGKEN